MIDRMNKLIRMNMYILELMSKYANFTKEDIKQTAMCAYCFDPDIDIHYQSGDIKTANKLLRKQYRKLIKQESFNPSVDRNGKLNRLITKLSTECSEYYTIEDDIVIPDDEILDMAREILGDADYFFVLKYYEAGMHRCSDIYNISEDYCRLKAHRLVKKIRNKLDNIL